MRWQVGALAMLCCLLGCYDARAAETRTYLIARADIPYVGSGVGFNLDDRVSSGATVACDDAHDLTSARGEEGIDNSLQIATRLLGAFPDPTFEEMIFDQIQRGEYLLLMEVTDIDSFDDDPSVAVRIYLGTTEGEVVAADEMAVADQTFEQRGGDIANLPLGSAAIAGGVLRFESPSFPLRFTNVDRSATFTLRDARVRAIIGEQALSEGEVGGRITIEEVVALDPETIDESAVHNLGLPDLDRDPTDPSICRAISVGFSFEAVIANPAAE
jgi:hypothetical protein